MIVLVGASASGKTEVTKVLAKKYDFVCTYTIRLSIIFFFIHVN